MGAGVESTHRPEASMHTQEQTEVLVDRLEDVLRRLPPGHGNPGPPPELPYPPGADRH